MNAPKPTTRLKLREMERLRSLALDEGQDIVVRTKAVIDRMNLASELLEEELAETLARAEGSEREEGGGATEPVQDKREESA